MRSEGRQKKIMEKLNRAQKCSILGPQNLGSGGGPGPPLDPHLKSKNAASTSDYYSTTHLQYTFSQTFCTNSDIMTSTQGTN